MAKYSWRRFWYPRSDTPNLADDGFLSDPDASPLFNLNPDLVTFDSLEDIPCLILLGEPGIGKSTSIFDSKNEISNRIQQKGDSSLWINLNAFGSEDRIIKSIFNSSEFQTWQKEQNNLYIFIDSFDECLLRVGWLASLFSEQLSNVINDKLFLRFICRTAVWPNSLEQKLMDHYKENQLKVYELAPLRKIDVIQAVQTNTMDADKFLSEILDKEVVPLAIKPVTLEFLIKTFKSKGNLPKKQSDLYYEGCLLLCTETNQIRIESGNTGILSSEQKLQIAARIAAITIFSKKNSIWTGTPIGKIVGDDLVFEEIINGKEILNNESIELTSHSIRQVLDTGLFSARDADRLGWAHQTYPEFLSAYYLIKHGLQDNQIMNLLTHPLDRENKLVPQLHETAAWIAGMNKGIFNKIIQSEPEVLLNSDVANADEKTKNNLVAELLNSIKKENILPNSISTSTLKKLAYPNLSKQLLPFLTDKTLNQHVRSVVIDIIEVCNVTDLQREILSIVLDNSETLPIRVNAAWAISNIAKSNIKKELRQIIFSVLPIDLYQELRGICLKILWPEYLTASELFSNIIDPSENHGGSYTMFLSYDAIKRLQIQDLPIALHWVSQLGPVHKLSNSFRHLADDIMILAWQNLKTKDVLDTFALAMFIRIKNYDDVIEDNGYQGKKLDPPFHVQLQENESLRRELLDKLISFVKDQKEATQLAYHRLHIGNSNDIEWLLHRMDNTDVDIEKVTISKIVKSVFDVNNVNHINLVFEFCQGNDILGKEFSYYFTPIDLGSTTAQEMKEEYANTQKWQNPQNTITLLKPPPQKRITDCLTAFEKGDFNAWWTLCNEMSLTPTSTHYGDDLLPDLTTFPGWVDSDKVTQNRIVNCAKVFIINNNPKSVLTEGINLYYFPDIAWVKAILLLLKEEQEFVFGLDSAVWQKWASIIIAYPTSVFDNSSETQHLLIKIAYQNAPKEVLRALSIIIGVESKGDGYIFVTKKFQNCWDDNISKLLYEKLKDETLNTNAITGLFEVLLDYKYDDLIKYAISLLAIPLPPQGRERDLAKIAARCLITHAKNKYWQIVWNAFKTDSEFGKDILLGVAYIDDRNLSIIKNLTEVELSDLYIWLENNFPRAEDPAVEGGHRITSRESIANWRENVLGYLQDKGTEKVIEEIQRLIHSLPHLNFLERVLLEAKKQTRRSTWNGVLPSEIVALANNSNLRLIQNGDQLLEVIIESLKNLDKKLQGETPLSQFLWDKKNNGSYEHKDEESLSDFIKNHLETELTNYSIIFNREVQIRRKMGSRNGEDTDIHVVSLNRDDSSGEVNTIKVIIEVKGCWHPKLLTAMETQLVERYLYQNQCNYGLYLVGWYGERVYPKETKDELKKRFENQAKTLSVNKTIKSFVLDVSL